MARVVVVGAGMAGLAVAARLAALGHEVVVCEQAETWGGKLGTFSRDGFTFDTGPSLLTLPDVYRDLFLATGRPLEECARPGARRPGGPLPVPRRRWARRDLARPARRLADPAAGSPRRGSRPRGRRRLGALPRPGPRHLAGDEGAVPRVAADRPARPAAPCPAYVGHPHRGALADAARAGAAVPPRPAAADAPRPLRDLHRVGPAPRAGGAGRGALRRADLRRLVRPRRAAPARRGGARARRGVRRPAAHRCRRHRGPRRGRSGARACCWPTASGWRRTSSSPTPTPLTSTATCCPRRSGGRARRRLARGTPSLSGFVLLLALRGRTPALAHHTVLFPDDYDAEFDAVFGRRGAPARPVDDPTVYVSAPDDPRCGRTTTTRPGSCW